jgi:hypothetical protein
MASSMMAYLAGTSCRALAMLIGATISVAFSVPVALFGYLSANWFGWSWVTHTSCAVVVPVLRKTAHMSSKSVSAICHAEGDMRKPDLAAAASVPGPPCLRCSAARDGGTSSLLLPSCRSLMKRRPIILDRQPPSLLCKARTAAEIPHGKPFC